MSVDLQTEVEARLRALHDDIDSCKVCEPSVSEFRKPLTMYRGEAGRVVIVGQGPGNTELVTRQAFSGKSGKRLDSWLVSSGFPTLAPRSGVYLTSVVKCACQTGSAVMRRNCAKFLERQLTTIRPQLVISLGEPAYKATTFTKLTFGSAVCRLFKEDSSEATFRSKLGFDYWHLVWPHPSPANRWHNLEANRDNLARSFNLLEDFFSEQRVV